MTPSTPDALLTGLTSVADLLEHLGGIPAERVRLHPTPGTAREEDVLRVYSREKRLCELVDGVLVEKAMGFGESVWAINIAYFLKRFLERHALGVVSGEAGMMRLASGLVRIPDVSFIRWERFPERKIPDDPIPDLAPDLAVEVLSKDNTEREMDRKVGEYFASGVRLVWLIDPRGRTAEVFTGIHDSTTLEESETLDGGDVLPGFSLCLAEVFRSR